jgi:hypothetical protein
MKCSNSAFNAQGLRVIIVVAQVGVVKIYICSGKGKRGSKDQTQFTTKIGEKTSLDPDYFVL